MHPVKVAALVVDSAGVRKCSIDIIITSTSRLLLPQQLRGRYGVEAQYLPFYHLDKQQTADSRENTVTTAVATEYAPATGRMTSCAAP